jgi:hypothetical protein
MKRLVGFLVAIVMATLTVVATPGSVRADTVTVRGGGVATFDDIPRLVSYFEVLATVDDDGNTQGEFTCMIVDFVILLGSLDRGTVQDDGSVLLEGTATAIRLVYGDVIEDFPFTVTVYTDPGHPHDAETVFLGGIDIE